jgi:ribosome assembly protein YihI (activator of Der GTPase)
MKKITDRVTELMEKYGLDTKDQVLVNIITVIYVEGQRDQIKEDMERLEDK